MSSITLRNVKGSALTFTELDTNFSNLNTDKLENITNEAIGTLSDVDVTGVANTNILSYNSTSGNWEVTAMPGGLNNVVEDTTPQLGGNLDVNGNSIVSTSAGNINITPDTTGSVVIDGLSWPQADGTTGQYLKTDGAGNLSWDTVSGTGITAVVDDTTPELGGDLDVGDFALVTTGLNSEVRIEPGTNKNISLNVAGTGQIYLNWATWPASDGTSGQVIQTDGLGGLSFTNPGISSVASDTNPSLGGNLDCGDFTVSAPVLEDYAETVYSLGSTDIPTLTVSNGNVQTVTITSGLTLPVFSDAATGQSMTLIVSGSGSVSGTGSHKFAGGNKTLTNDSVISIFYDGTTYWTSVATDFQA